MNAKLERRFLEERLNATTLGTIVKSYFQLERNGATHRLTQLQLLESDCGSTTQIWHADNINAGITILIPLVDVTEDNGPTELIPHSHTLFPSFSIAKFFSLLLSDGSSHKGVASAGDALVYDCRTIHRGLATPTSASASRPVVIFRYDAWDTPPPGVSAVGTTLIRTLGNIWQLFL